LSMRKQSETDPVSLNFASKRKNILCETGAPYLKLNQEEREREIRVAPGIPSNSLKGTVLRDFRPLVKRNLNIHRN
jgi:hypothetical protein